MPTDIVFQAWPKTPRLNRGMIITEKIDGTNACVIITDDGKIGAQSRNRLITPESDNAGFAHWVWDNHPELISLLGPGYHYGEWWGQGIQRGYGLSEKRFSLFNSHRWGDVDLSSVPQLNVVPTLVKTDIFNTVAVNEMVVWLAENGSLASPGYMKPEGVIVYLNAANTGFKVLIENDALPKGLVA